MKHLFTLLFVSLISSSFSQKITGSPYVGAGIYSIHSLKMNNLLEQNSLEKVNLNMVEINYGVQVNYYNFNVFGEGFMALNTGKSRLFSQGFRTGLGYSFSINPTLKIRSGIYYRYMVYSLTVNNSSDHSAQENQLSQANGGDLNFRTSSSALGVVVGFVINDKFELKVGAESPFQASEWDLRNNNIDPLEKELFSQAYFGVSYFFKNKLKK